MLVVLKFTDMYLFEWLAMIKGILQIVLLQIGLLQFHSYHSMLKLNLINRSHMKLTKLIKDDSKDIGPNASCADLHHDRSQ